jgi:LuxR family maltose regulon positive regulatory protein
MRQSRTEATFLDWLKAIPDTAIERRPVLCAAYAHVLLATGQSARVEAWLQAAERQMDLPTAVVVDHDAFRHLPGTIAIARAGLALGRGDVPETVTYARQALDLAADDDDMTRGGAAGFLGLVAWMNGELETAYRTFAEGMASLQKAGSLSDAVNGALTLGAIRLAQGRLHQATRAYEQALQLATSQASIVRGAADIETALSAIDRERNQLEAATQRLLRSQALGEHAGYTQNRYRWRVAMARIREAEGQFQDALDLLDEAETLYMSDFSPNVRPVAAMKTRIWIAQGRLGEALDWARARGLSADDELTYVREFEHLTLARLLLSQYRNSRDDSAMRDATRILERLLQAAESGERTASVIEILVLEALAYQMQGNLSTAMALLERALMLAEPEGYIRLFVDEGAPMADLLGRAAKQDIAPSYVRQLRAAFGSIEATPVRQALPEPLSERELDVLRLLGTDLSGPEIAQELVVSLSTLRTHTQNIYTKLGVNSRRTAVRRAEELGLI